MSIELAVTIIAAATVVGTVIAILELLAHLRADRARRRDVEIFKSQQAALIDQQSEFRVDANRYHQDWKDMVERETGKPFAQITDAEILQIVRREDDAPVDAPA